MISGIAWYKREQWDRLRQISADVDTLERTFDEWEKGASNLLRALERAGQRVSQVMVDVDELVAWCAARGRSVDGSARSEFVASTLRSRGEHQ